MRLTDLCLIADVKDEYIKLRQNGSGRSDAVKALIESYNNELTIGQYDDGLLFWVGLADGQYHFKELETEIAEKATDALCTIETYDWDVTPGDIVRRKEKYKQAPMPEHKVGKSRKFRCQWQIGDTFAYQLNGDAAAEKGLAGKYVLIRKVDEQDDGEGRIVPVVTFSLLGDESFPKSEKAFSAVPLIKIRPARKFKGGRVCFLTGDPSTQTFEYRAGIRIKSNKELESKQLTYVGHFENVRFPTDEILPDSPYFTHFVLLSKFYSELLCLIERNGLSK